MMLEPRADAYDGLAQRYQRARPSYPKPLLDELVAFAIDEAHPAAEAGLFLDVGCGTGIFTRLLGRVLPAAVEVVGVEPGADMREEAWRWHGGAGRVRFVEGRAEALPFPDQAAFGIVAATAAHWFERPAFYGEAARVLEPSGTLAVIENNRAWDKRPFLAQYEDLLEEYSPSYRRDYRRIDYDEDMRATSWFDPVTKSVHVWERRMAADDFFQLCLTSTRMQAALLRAGNDRVTRALRTLVSAAADSHDQVSVAYRSELYLGRRRDASTTGGVHG